MSRMIPRGHEVAGLGRRFLAYLIDVAPVAIVGGLQALVLQLWASPTVMLVTSISAAVLILGYGLFQWWAYATKGAGIGARAMGLELVGLSDGKPIGWWRVFLRFLVFIGLMATVVGGIAFLVFLIIHERRQGWHDMAVKSVLVQPKPEPAAAKPAQNKRKGTMTSTVGLPPHLAEAFSPEARYSPEAGHYRGGEWAQQEPQGQQAPFSGAQGYGSPGSFAQPPQSQSSGPSFGPPGMSSASPGSFQSLPPSPPQGYGSQPGQQPSPQPGQPPQQGGQPPQQPGQPPQSQPQSPQPPQATPPPRTKHAGWIPMPPPSSVLQPSQKSVRVRPRDFGDVQEDDGTTIASLPSNDGARPGDEGWYIRLDDGREVELTVTVLLGRNPQRGEEDPEAHLVPASGDGRMISRTHVLIGTDPRGVFVVDRASTNGTALVGEAGALEPAPAGVQVRVREGQQVSYGNRWFTVLRRPAA